MAREQESKQQIQEEEEQIQHYLESAEGREQLQRRQARRKRRYAAVAEFLDDQAHDEEEETEHADQVEEEEEEGADFELFLDGHAVADADLELPTSPGAEGSSSLGAARWGRRVGEVWDFQGDTRAVWRVSLPSNRAAATVATLRQTLSAEAVYDWGGSLVWLATDASVAAATAVRHLAGAAGGHAWLFRAPPALRTRVPAAHPQPAALQALSARIKKGFDPLGVFPDAPLTQVPREPR